MTRRLLLIFAAFTVLAAAGASWYIHHVMSDSPGAAVHSVPKEQRVQTVNGETVVVVAPDVQRASGIEVAPLKQSTVQAERTAYATVIDLQPLFELGNRLAAARADRDSASAQTEASRAQYERAQGLYKDDRNVSLKSVQEARAVAQSDQAKLHAAETAQGGLEANLRQQFGEVLANASAAPASGLFRQLSNGLASVIRVTLPVDDNLAAPAHIVVDGPNGQRLSARKLSAAPQIDPAVQGSSYFYLAERALPVGARTTGHIALEGKSATGLLIPDSALVWYGGQRWAYVRTAPDRFTRRLVPSAFSTTDGIIAASGYRAGDKVAIRGAQLLLSEEQRPQGIATQCKDPPECDD
jgi:multidrug efflux system membrane fusion protein